MAVVVQLYGVISIAPVDIGEKPGLSGGFNGSFDTQRGNTDSDNYAAGLKISYDNNRSYLMWGELSFAYGEASGTKNANKTYAHLRYIHVLEKKLDSELFVQSQSNEFTRVDKRVLGGGGLRLHMVRDMWGDFYIGLGAFYEYITYTTNTDADEKNIRANAYVAYKKDLNKYAKFSYILYYQPRLRDSADYIISNAAELQILIYKKIFVNFKISYNKDSQPAVGVKQVDVSQRTSFTYKF
jgi:putative salt-induced outer membrane protein YdiY